MCCLQGMAQIGTWKVYPSYNHITDVQQAGSTIYTLASGGLFAYHKSDNSVQTFDRTTGLNDTEITHIGYNRAAKRLVIAVSYTHLAPLFACFNAAMSCE